MPGVARLRILISRQPPKRGLFPSEGPGPGPHSRPRGGLCSAPLSPAPHTHPAPPSPTLAPGSGPPAPPAGPGLSPAPPSLPPSLSAGHRVPAQPRPRPHTPAPGRGGRLRAGRPPPDTPRPNPEPRLPSSPPGRQHLPAQLLPKVPAGKRRCGERAPASEGQRGQRSEGEAQLQVWSTEPAACC